MNQKDLKKFQEFFELLMKAEQENAVAAPIPSAELFTELDLELPEFGMDDDSYYQHLEELVLKTPRTSSNMFFNQLYGGRISKSVLGDLLAVMLNTSMYTYKVAGPMVGVEKTIIKAVCGLIGFGPNADGTIAPGGSMSNFMAMVMARDAIGDSIQNQGLSQKMTLYTSEVSHYSILKNASLMGVGKEQVRFIPVNQKGEMDVEALDRQIEKDKNDSYLPFFVNATAGTTVLGAFDPIEAISEVCRKHRIWLHIDGAYCGAVIFSDRYKSLVKGAELSDSFSVNAHKMLGTSLTCSLLLCKQGKHLLDSFASDASYLYQSEDDEFNLGKTSLQCGRRNDALKLWSLWKYVGSNGLKQLIEHQFDLADFARDYVRNHSDYELYSFDSSISVCFNYKGLPAEKLSRELYQNGIAMVSYGHFKDQEFIRFVTINSNNTTDDIRQFFQKLEEFASTNESLLT